MPDPFRRLLARLDGGPAILDDDDRLGLADNWEPLVAGGLVVPTAPATAAACDACDDPHFGEAFPVDVEGLPPRWFVRCPTFGSVRVPADRLRRWAARVPALGLTLAGREAEERVPELAWRLGPIPVGAAERSGWLVAGWRGRTGIADAVPELLAPNAVVFVPAHLPTVEVWGTVTPVVVSLTEVLSVGGDGLVLNRRRLAEQLPPEPTPVAVDCRPRLELPSGTAWEDVTLVIGDHHLELRLGRVTHRVGYEDLGLADGRNGAPGLTWRILRRLAAAEELGTGDRITTKPAVLRTHVGRMRRALASWTGLGGDPFQATRPLQPYRPRFRIRAAETLGPA